MLISLWFFSVLLGTTIAALLGWAAMEARRRFRIRARKPVLRGWSAALARAGAGIVCLSLAGATIGDGVNRHFAYIPSFEALIGHVSADIVGSLPPSGAALDRATPEHGSIIGLSIGDARLRVHPRPIYVYLPPAYFDSRRPDQRFPVLYLLHGSPGISLDWIRAGHADTAMDELLHAHRIRPFIIVFPDFNQGYARDTECEDVVGGPQMQTFLVHDVVAFVDSHFRTIPDRKARAMGGLSTGGYCAINLMFRHPDVFSAAISHSGYYKPDLNTYTGALFGGSTQLLLANTPASYLPYIPIEAPTGVYLDAGADDPTSRSETLTMARELHGRGVSLTVKILPGAVHTWTTWRDGLFTSLPWVSAWFERMGVAAADGSAPAVGHHVVA